MRNLLKMIISYGIMGLSFSCLYHLLFKGMTMKLDEYFNTKFNSFEAKEIILEKAIDERLQAICKTERRTKTQQINLILDEWMTEYEKKERDNDTVINNT